MCGILGYCGPAGSMPAERFCAGLDRLAHRGPDDWGTEVIPLGDHAVHLGHRRLSILDLSPLGHQPMASPRTGLWITFNGEIYNFQDIREELERKGYSFRSNCDTEVMLAAYDEWGIDCVSRFNGMFAFALCDVRRGRIILVRDRIGIKPLYYFHDGSRLAFGSELTALTTLELGPLRLRTDAVAEFFAYSYIPDDLTPLENYHKLRPGHVLEFDAASGKIETRAYWNLLDAYAAPPLEDDEHVLQERLEALLTDAVRLRLISDVPLGAFLSGGIDSTIVAALMTRVSTGKVKTFTIGFTFPEWDEAPHARRVAAHLGTEHHEQYISPKGLEEGLIDAASLYDEPFADSSAIPTMLLSRMTRQHVTVALSGDGGDELYHGYERYLKSSRYRQLFRTPYALRLPAAAVLSCVPHYRPRAWAYVLASPSLDGMYARQITSRVPQLVRGNHATLSAERLTRTVLGRLGPDPWERIPGVTDLLSFMPGDLLTKVDRASMSVALEARVPILDYRFVEFSARVPHHFKYRNGTTKYLLRKVLAKYVPRELWERPKAGFSIPLGQWFRAELQPWVCEVLLTDWDWTFDVIDRRIAEKIILDHLEGRGSHAQLLWSFVCWKLWVQRSRLRA